MARAEKVLETSPLGILMSDRTGRIVWANQRAEEMFGYARDELGGLAVELLLPEHLRGAHLAHRASFFDHPRVRPMGLGLDLVARRKDGRTFPVEISLSFIETDEGLFALSFITDVTPRREAERRLQAEFAVTRVFAESGPMEGLAPRLLLALCESLDWDLGEFWRVDEDVLRSDAIWYRETLDAEEFATLGRQVPLARGMGIPGRVWATGEALWAEDVAQEVGFVRAAAAARLELRSGCAFPVRSDQRMIGIMVLLRREVAPRDHALLTMLSDIGSRIGQHLEHRRTEEELRRQREILYQSEKLAALGRLVAGVAHEMNNPLGIISSRIELMLADAQGQALPAQHLEDLSVVHRNVLRVAGVAKALRSFARHSPGERQPVTLNKVVEETLLLAGKPLSTDNVRVITALDPDLPPLLGDGNALQQVVLNLLTNAREAMTTGGEIRVSTGPVPGRPRWVRLVIADTGPGIAPRDLPHLFEPFYTTKASGTGLGLAVSYGIVQDHGGTIEVESSPGKGATFTLSFPAIAPA
ncbi:MAG TPA: ATP-binding protein [Methylomirabilota bacterium]|nr:ATP-binding protein [Methylomirabilota bacterium]